MVERQTDTKDKRSVGIFLLKEGEQLIQEMRMLINNSIQSRMSEKDIQNIKRLVE
ncbi:hypothetical protein J14TS2_34090 [Bacillus sp. J14TS2]|uniref:hypothetical protein n=1 Tax=Bacillus sp. J14TS2 TaxID=2807188 RepID=UPI001B2DDD87|nr:hypothetical protein [Bacillus sp. J14TS2]GIN72934.1 hypothetical protein J14TS2_34090 [Bacillus sp. J14TS2]